MRKSIAGGILMAVAAAFQAPQLLKLNSEHGAIQQEKTKTPD